MRAQKNFKTWHYKKFANSIIPGLEVETDRHKTKAFYDALKELIIAIDEEISNLINYDHISYVVPKSNLPLRYENMHYCLSYIDTRGNLVLLFMSVVEREKLSKKVRDEIWRKEP